MLNSNRPLGLFFLLAACQPALLASAAPLIFEFGGVIDFVEDGLPISDQIAVGMPYTGVYQFDPEGIQDSNPLPNSGTYHFGDAGSMSVDIGSVNFVTPDLRVFVQNSSILDLYKVGNGAPFDAHGTTWLEMQIDLRDVTHSAFDSTDLPLTAPDLGDFEFSRLFYLLQPNRREFSVTGTVTYLNMVPEPSSLATLFAAAVTISLRRRRPCRASTKTPTP